MVCQSYRAPTVKPRPHTENSICDVHNPFAFFLRALVSQQLPIQPGRNDQPIVDPELLTAIWTRFSIARFQFRKASPEALLSRIADQGIEIAGASFIPNEHLHAARVAAEIRPTLFTLSNI
jgi:hypothetical protein